ncbi:MAG: PAS domain S-box protein [Spirochaetaceae bacterium]|nr:MAG: PAS domain S-box protein [Spirochaetaceae bacterium]
MYNLFDIEELQTLQDQFSQAMHVAALITLPDGTPVTRPSGFTRLCHDVIRATEIGNANCMRSDAAFGVVNPDGPIVHRCLSCGLWDAGANISAGEHHVANWLIGQVRNEAQDESEMRAYARTIGADEDAFMSAYHDVPEMSVEQFNRIAQLLYTVAKQLSHSAHQNLLKARHIEERKLIEAALRESDQRFRRVLQDVASVAIQGYRADGTVTFWNDACLDLYGYSASEAVGANLLDLIILPEHRDQVAREVRQMVETGVVLKPGELRLKRKDGTPIDVYSSHTIVHLPGREPELFCLDVDISQRVRDQTRIVELLQEKETLLKEVHHRVKNNMNTMVSLLSLQAGTLHDPDAVAALNDARSRFGTMEVLYDQLYRAEAHGTGRVSEYLSRLVSQVVGLFPAASRVRVQLISEEGHAVDQAGQAPEIPDLVSIDVKRLSTLGLIINELVTNAMKYGIGDRPEGTVTVCAGFPAGSVMVSVEDDGPGMPLPAHPGDHPAGFGLTMVEALTEQLGGTITFEPGADPPGSGTRAVLTFPA